MKRFNFSVFICSLLFMVGCSGIESEAPLPEKTEGRQISLTVSMPSGIQTRVALAETEEGNISVKWKAGDKISLCFVKGETVKTLSDVLVTNIREEDKKADFSFTLPEGIDYPFDLYGVYGATLAANSKAVTFPTAPTVAKELADAEPICVMRFEAKNLTVGAPVSVNFSHLGALMGVWLKNTSAANYTLNTLSLAGNDGYNWLYNASGQAVYDIATQTFTDAKAGASLDYPLGSSVTIAAGTTTKVYRWMVPTTAPDVSKTITATLNGTAMAQALPAKAFTAGKYYRLKLIWSGTAWKRFILPPASDLVAHWPMDGNANDVSGNNHHGTIVGGVTPTADHRGTPNSAYLFNGTDGAIHLTEGATNVEASTLGLPQNAISISTWVKIGEFGKWSGLFTFIQDTWDFEYGISLNLPEHTSNRRFVFGLAGGGIGLTYLHTGNTCTTGQWYFITGTYDGTTMKLYVDGELSASSNAQSGNIAYSPSRGRIGKYEDDNENNFFKGAIDDMRIYNRALTEDEVVSLYHQTK